MKQACSQNLMIMPFQHFPNSTRRLIMRYSTTSWTIKFPLSPFVLWGLKQTHHLHYQNCLQLEILPSNPPHPNDHDNAPITSLPHIPLILLPLASQKPSSSFSCGLLDFDAQSSPSIVEGFSTQPSLLIITPAPRWQTLGGLSSTCYSAVQRPIDA